jgi:hypothetical protein
MRTKRGYTIMGAVAETSFETVTNALRFTNAVENQHSGWADTREALARVCWSSACAALDAQERRGVLYVLQTYWALWPQYRDALLALNTDLKEVGQP